MKKKIIGIDVKGKGKEKFKREKFKKKLREIIKLKVIFIQVESEFVSM